MQRALVMDPENSMVDFAAIAQEIGLDGLEWMDLKPGIQRFANMKQERQILRDHGTKIGVVGLWKIGLADPPAKGSADIIKAGMDYAAEMGASCFYTGTGDPEGDDPVGALADCYGDWLAMAEQHGLQFGVYTGHWGSFLNSEKRLAETVARVPGVKIKFDPVGIMRNLRADPLYVLGRYAPNMVHFHVKGLIRVADREFEPPPGLDTLPWGAMFGIIHEAGYDGWVSAEPHNRFWMETPARRKKYTLLTFRALGPFMGD